MSGILVNGDAGYRYGVGQIYYRQEKYEMAAYHFASGLKVPHPSATMAYSFTAFQVSKA